MHRPKKLVPPMAALEVPGGQGVGEEAPGRQKEPAGQGKGVVEEELGGQKVPAGHSPAGEPLEQSMPGGQGTQLSWRMRLLR